MRQRTVAFAPEAQDDLLRLYDWIADAAGESVALGYIERIERTCLGLRWGSECGQARHDIRPGLRVIGFKRRVTIAFSVSDIQVTILRVFYGGHDWQRAFM